MVREGEAMRILEERKSAEHSHEWSAELRCPECGKLLLVETGDIRYANFATRLCMEMNDIRAWRFYCTCASCQEDIILVTNTLPHDVRQLARMRGH
jgi:hypothetical protein